VKRDGLKICETKSDSSGKFSFSNVAFAKYKIKATLSKHDVLEFAMKPGHIDVDLTRHENVALTEPFQLDSVSVQSVALLSDKVINRKKQAKKRRLVNF
jgi:hypothetical protein